MLDVSPREDEKGMGWEEVVKGDRRKEHNFFCQPGWVTAAEQPLRLAVEQ